MLRCNICGRPMPFTLDAAACVNCYAEANTRMMFALLEPQLSEEIKKKLKERMDENTPLPRFQRVQDSGARQEFQTGSVRDTQEGKPRLDLIPPLWLTRLGNHLGNGAKKYGDNNWQRGQPLTRYYGSAMRHLIAYRERKDDEDHAAAVAWNILAAMWTENEIAEGRLPAELDDR